MNRLTSLYIIKIVERNQKRWELNRIHQLLKHAYDFNLLNESVYTRKMFGDLLEYTICTMHVHSGLLPSLLVQLQQCEGEGYWSACRTCLRINCIYISLRTCNPPHTQNTSKTTFCIAKWKFTYEMWIASAVVYIVCLHVWVKAFFCIFTDTS